MLPRVTNFNWTSYEWIEHEINLIDNSYSWEESSILSLLENFLLNLFFSDSFINTMVLVSPNLSFSLGDFVTLNLITPDKNLNLSLVNNFYTDWFILLTNLNLTYKYLFFLGSNDYLLLIQTFNSELIIALSELFNYSSLFVVKELIAYQYGYFFNTPDILLIEYTNFYSFLLISILLYWVFNFYLSKTSYKNTFQSLWTRYIYYFYSVSRENRIQFELFIQLTLFFIFSWVFTLMAYDDDEVEFIESISVFLSFYFLFIVSFLLFKYSVHYFSFLEASFIEGKSSSFIAKQFVRDVSNTFALFLRFFLLLLRLNIYDGLDDFLDSYYIAFIDFDCDTYYDELLVLSDSNLFFITDNHNDSGIYDEIESDILEDIFQKYFVTVGKFAYFWGFILEEAFRISLALYISYLIIFEVHSVNVSYKEDLFVSKKFK